MLKFKRIKLKKLLFRIFKAITQLSWGLVFFLNQVFVGSTRPDCAVESTALENTIRD